MKTTFTIIICLFVGVIIGHFGTKLLTPPDHRICQFAIQLKVEEVDSLKSEYNNCRNRYDQLLRNCLE